MAPAARRPWTLSGTLLMAALVTTALIAGWFAAGHSLEPAVATLPPGSATPAPGFIYGRITTADDDTYEGRLRWGRDQEAFWTDYFDGVKKDNAWAAHAPREDAADASSPLQIFGVRVGGSPPALNLRRLFMARFGDLARIEAHFADVQVTLKSGTVHTLNRFDAGDIDDGVRVWDGRRGVVDLEARQIRTIEFMPTPPVTEPPARLHGTVRTQKGEFTGFILWDRQDALGTDTLTGRADEGERQIRFDAIHSIARHSRDSALVTLGDGEALVLSNAREVDHRNRGISVDDARYGRVVLGWNEFVRVEFTDGGSGPAYEAFSSGRHLAGQVTTRDGRRLSGRLVYDFDESETTDTFDGAFEGVTYTIPFGLIAAIVVPGGEARSASPAAVLLQSGAELSLEPSGDVGDQNAGMLIFVEDGERPEYVAWDDVARIDFDPTTSPAGT